MLNQTLFIPKAIQIQLRDKENQPIEHENILLGIKTRANRKNDIVVYPFLSDKRGCIKISAGDIRRNTDKYISYGLMDYVPIETAKPLIDIYYWGSKAIQRYLQHYNKRLVNQKMNFSPGGLFVNLPDDLIKEMEEDSNQEREEYNIFNECYNRKLAIENNILLIRDKWDKENEYLEYNVTLSL